jgi:hypothetical protein
MVSELGRNFAGYRTVLHGQCHLGCRKEGYKQLRNCLSLQLFRGNGVTSVVQLDLPLQWLVRVMGSCLLVTVDVLIRGRQLHGHDGVSDLQVQVELGEQASSWAGLRVLEDPARPG